MKKNIFILACFLFAANFSSALVPENATEESQIINLESANLEYDFGDVKKDTITKRVIIILNKLNEALEIKDARSTCECIKIKIQPKTVDRNGIFEVEVTFDSTGIARGQEIEEVAYIITANQQHELIRFVVSVAIVK